MFYVLLQLERIHQEKIPVCQSYVFLPPASANDCSQSQDIGLDVQLTVAIYLIVFF